MKCPYKKGVNDEADHARGAHAAKIENHAHAVAVHFMWYNFGRTHQTLRCTPAMRAGVSDHVWSTEEIVNLLG